MLETFERFAQQEYIGDQHKDPFVRSHPVAVDRLSQLRTLVQASPNFATRDNPALQFRHDMMRAKLSGYLERPGVVMNRYPLSNTTLPARYARAIAKFFQGGAGALQASIADIDAMIKERPDYPFFHELRGDLLMRAGKPAEAVPSIRQALKLTGDSDLVRVQLARALLATNNGAVVAEASELLRKSLIADQNPHAYRALADAAYRQGRQPEAEAALAQAYFLEGDLKQAQIVAKRAQVGLQKGTPAWIRMEDIVLHKPQT
jgi:predicted Zn-dependent protease